MSSFSPDPAVPVAAAADGDEATPNAATDAPLEAPESSPALTEQSSCSKGRLVAIVLLSIALAAAVAALVYFFIQLSDANTLIDDQEREIEQQRELIDKRETFGAALTSLLQTAEQLDGVLMATVVPFDTYQAAANRAWSNRWSTTAMDRAISDVETAHVELKDRVSVAAEAAVSNATGRTFETTLDSLGGGWVTTVIDDADTLCETDVLACVAWDDPYTVHFDGVDTSQPYMTDWLLTGLAYHEFAHVLQMTNPDPTDEAVEAFGGDYETMADCFALTYLPGWVLDHRIWVSSVEYWDISMGYGHTCDATQAQVVRDWYGKLGVQSRPIT